MEETNIQRSVIGLTGLAVEFCKALAAAESTEAQALLRDVVRYLPRIYITISDIDPLGVEKEAEGDVNYMQYNTDAMGANVTEEQYEIVREGLAQAFGEYDVYLDTPVEDMRYSDTPVGVSLSEQLADIFQQLADFVATVSATGVEDAADVVAELKYRFHSYLSDTICSTLRAANNLYQSQTLVEQ